jgi:hypothetical protein
MGSMFKWKVSSLTSRVGNGNSSGGKKADKHLNNNAPPPAKTQQPPPPPPTSIDKNKTGNPRFDLIKC